MGGWILSCSLKKPGQTLPSKTEQKELCELYGGERIAPQRGNRKDRLSAVQTLATWEPWVAPPTKPRAASSSWLNSRRLCYVFSFVHAHPSPRGEVGQSKCLLNPSSGFQIKTAVPYCLVWCTLSILSGGP